MSIADIKSNDSKTLGPVQNHTFEDEMVPLRRHEYVNMGDLELNFYSNEKNISEISLNATAEVKKTYYGEICPVSLVYLHI